MNRKQLTERLESLEKKQQSCPGLSSVEKFSIILQDLKIGRDTPEAIRLKNILSQYDHTSYGVIVSEYLCEKHKTEPEKATAQSLAIYKSAIQGVL